MNLVESYYLPPGSCINCGGTQREIRDEHGGRRLEHILDTLRDLDDYGRVYLCESCIGAFARMLGFMTPVEATKAREQVVAMGAELDQARAAAVEAQAALEALDRFRGSLTIAEEPPAGAITEITTVDDELICEECPERGPFKNEQGRISHLRQKHGIEV